MSGESFRGEANQRNLYGVRGTCHVENGWYMAYVGRRLFLYCDQT